MITEDYCSFEISKLLKEKGFDEACYSYYMTTKTLHTTFHNRVHVEEEPHFNSGDLNGMYDVDESSIEDICSAPTHQKAMKWLREVHNKHCDIGYDLDLGWFFQIIDLKETVEYDYPEIKYYHAENETNFETYEEAVEAALKYCLKLI